MTTQQQPQLLLLLESYASSNNVEQLFLNLQNIGVCEDMAYNECMRDECVEIKCTDELLDISSTYRIEGDRAPKCYTVVEPADDTPNSIEDLKVMRV